MSKKVSRTTEEGFLMFENVVIATVGVHKYKCNDATEYQFKSKEELFKDSHIKSGIGKPVTFGHPIQPVNLNNIQQCFVGTILNIYPSPDNENHLLADIVISSKKGTEAIKSKKATELSLGYSVVLSNKSGEYEGQSYNKVQTDMRINHLALVSKSRVGKVTSVMDSNEESIWVQEKCSTKKQTEDNIKILHDEQNIEQSVIQSKIKFEKEKNELIQIQEKLKQEKDLLEESLNQANDKIKNIEDKIKNVEDDKILKQASFINDKLGLKIQFSFKNHFDLYKELLFKAKEFYNIEQKEISNDELNQNTLLKAMEDILLAYQTIENKKKEYTKKSSRLISQQIEEIDTENTDPIALFNKINLRLSAEKTK